MGISLKNVSYIYQAGTPFEGRALFDMTTTIKDGSYTAFIGHTGSGKSTIMQLLNGLYLPTSGQVHVDDTIITSQSKNKDIKPIRKKVGLVFQFPESQLFAETVLEDVAFGPQNFGVSKEEAEQRAIESLKLVGLPEEFHGQNPFDLSGGQMRRVAIAGILAMQPDILVLDEPTAGLDPQGRKELMSLFKELHLSGMTIVLVTHLMDDVAFGPQNFGVSKEEAEQRAIESLKLVGLPEEFHGQNPFDLSGGQMRRVAIAGILAMQPDILVLDEPTAGLDPQGRKELMSLFKELHLSGMTIVLVTHLMDDVADYATAVNVMEKGQLVLSGTPKDVFQKVTFLKEKQLGVPKITEFALQLQEKGYQFESLPITIEEFVEVVSHG